MAEELLQSVDQTLEVRRCKKSGRDYLLCDYNRDGDSWRSPWSNEFDPPLEDEDEGNKPSERVRKMEVKMGEAIDVYRELYVNCSTGWPQLISAFDTRWFWRVEARNANFMKVL